MSSAATVGVVVQANELLSRSVVLVAPRSRSARPAGAVDETRLGDLVGHVTPQQHWGIDEALLTVLGSR